MKIAMWSGPRNLSSAMMYAFAQHPDFAVWDEPFYAAYLAISGEDHPMRDAVIECGISDPQEVARKCAGPVPDGKSHWYMKHMPHHMISGIPIDWAQDCVNVHLIRHPARVIASYAARREAPTFDDIGFRQQSDLYDRIGGVVIDSADVRDDPKAMLTALCTRIGIAFDDAMLSWPKGGNPADGPWAPHWYGSLHASTGFAGPEGHIPDLPEDQAELAARALPYYAKLHALRITA